MWFWIWFANGGTINMQKALLWAAGASALLGASLLTFSATRTDWPEAAATVVSVRDGCELRSSGIGSGRFTRIVLECDQIERFRADNLNETWSLRRFHEGRVRLTGAGPTAVVEMGLNGYFGPYPKVGDQTQVLRDPANPQRVAAVGWQWHVAIPGYMLLGLSALLGVIAFAWL